MTHPTLKHPGRWIWLVLLVPIIVGLARLRFDVEVFDLLPADLPVVQGLKLYQDHFANARQLLIAVKGSSAEQTESAARRIAERLEQQTNLVASVTWEPPWLEHPDQIAELIAYLWFNEPPGVFEQLRKRLAPDQLAGTLASTREQLATSLSPGDIARLSYDPFGLMRLPGGAANAAPSFERGSGLFSSPDGRFRVVFVQARAELLSYRDCKDWLSAVKPVVDAAAAAGGQHGAPLSIGYTGRPALVAETASGMQHDVTVSVGGTAGIIALLFWLAHRRVKPMLWLLALLALILASTLALGGLIFGRINVVSIGFAAILLGLAVDYAVVHYQEALAHPNLSIPQIRHAIAPSILWAAITTITAFLVLNFGGLPGLAQLGTLVGLGVALAATIMIFEFLPPLFPDRKEPGPELTTEPPQGTRPGTGPGGDGDEPGPGSTVAPRRQVQAVFGITIALVASTLGVLVVASRPPIDPTANALRPRRSPAYETLEQIQSTLGGQQELLWIIVGGTNVEAVARRLDDLQSRLETAVSNRLITRFTLPTPLWPRQEYQAANRATARALATERAAFKSAAVAAGFTPSSLRFSEQILDAWNAASAAPGIYWPTNPLSQWILDKVVARTPTNDFALGLVNPETNSAAAERGIQALQSELPKQDVWLSGWELLGRAIFMRVKANLWKVVGPMIFLVLLSLWFAFRRPAEIVLSLAALVLSGLCLLTLMRIAGWSWNLLDLMAIPLVLGTGVDYSIFMQLALRRYHGDLRMAYHSVGRALLLCGGTAIAAFASLAWSTNAGMASLGSVCAVGIACNVLIAIFLAPIWWHAVSRRNPTR